MPRITPVDAARATGKLKNLLDAVQTKLGMVPNLMKTFANSPAALEAYLAFSSSLGRGLLTPAFQEQIALTVAQANACEYCLAAHSVLGSGAGLTQQEIDSARNAHSTNDRQRAGLQFAQAIVVQRGQVSEKAINLVRSAGYSDGEIVEIVAHVALNVLTNYINHVACTTVDFPHVAVAVAEPTA